MYLPRVLWDRMVLDVGYKIPERYSTGSRERKAGSGGAEAFLLAVVCAGRMQDFETSAIAKAMDAANVAHVFRTAYGTLMPRLAAAAFFISLSSLGLSPSGAYATVDAAAPVKAVMDATVANWSGGDSDWQDIFEASKLAELYSKDFVEKYQAAAKFPAIDDDGISPFDFDVIVGGQDACPLEDVTITPQAPAGPITEVVARFKKSTCMGTAAEFQSYTSVRFEVTQSDGKPVIDDILTVDDDGKTNSLKDMMESIVKEQQAQPQQPQ